MPNNLPSTTDVVFVDTLRVEANLGADCWGRARAQPVEITVYLHLQPSFLHIAGQSDDVMDSVHYGHLAKQIRSLVRAKSDSTQSEFDGPDGLIAAVSDAAFTLAGEAAAEVRVVLKVPKMILLASGFYVDTTTVRGTPNIVSEKKVTVEDIITPVVIGVNPPERKNKQRIVVNINFHEKLIISPAVNYRDIVSRIVEVRRSTSHTQLHLTFYARKLRKRRI